MAIDSTRKRVQMGTSMLKGEMGITDVAKAILAPLASLKLTVVLLVLAVVVIFVATIDQTRNDILEVKHKHFESPVVLVPFQTFFVPRWFPEYQNVPGGFYIPSGVSILVMMLLNLTACALVAISIASERGEAGCWHPGCRPGSRSHVAHHFQRAEWGRLSGETAHPLGKNVDVDANCFAGNRLLRRIRILYHRSRATSRKVLVDCGSIDLRGLAAAGHGNGRESIYRRLGHANSLATRPSDHCCGSVTGGLHDAVPP